MRLSIVMPCLNEHETVGICVEKAVRTLREHGIEGEVIVADNGSTDGSIEIAESGGARVVHVSEKGYGAALMGGIESARGQYVLMGDADDSYDFTEAPKFLAKLETGLDLVQGCRLPAGGGTVMPGAMPWLHYWIGNPGLTWLARRMFHVPIHDIYCGMRGFSKDLYLRLNQQCTGMEFATEMIIKSTLFGEKIGEVPITLHPDGRKTRRPHLRTFRDGWRTLRFFLLFSPRWVFLYPALALILAGMAGYFLVYLGFLVGVRSASVQTLLVCSVLILLGIQTAIFGLFARVYAYTEGFLPNRNWLARFESWFDLEKQLVGGAILAMIGIALIALIAIPWGLSGFGPLDIPQTALYVIPGVTLVSIGFLLAASSFFLGILMLHRRK